MSLPTTYPKPLETLPRAGPTALPYGQPSTERRRRLVRVALILGLLSVFVAGIKFIPATLRNYQLLALQAACAEHTLPANFVVLDTDPIAAAKKFAAGTHEKVFNHSVHSAVPASVPSPAGYVFKPWRALYNAIGPSNSRPSDAIAFVGMLTSPAGNKRLVCMDFSMIVVPDQLMPKNSKPIFPNDKIVFLRWCVVLPGTPTSPPTVVTPFSDQTAQGLITHIFGGNPAESAQFSADSRPNHESRVLIRAGLVDPHDPSHVTIDVEDWEHKAAWRLHARLCDNDRLRIQPDPPQVLEMLKEP